MHLATQADPHETKSVRRWPWQYRYLIIRLMATMKIRFMYHQENDSIVDQTTHPE